MRIVASEEGEIIKIMMRAWDDFHAHIRTDDVLKTVLPHTARYCARALAMPNILPPVLDGSNALFYKGQIMNALPKAGRCGKFQPLMTIKIVDRTTPVMIRGAHKAGVIAGKVYPVGVTNNSEDGVTDFEKLYPVFQEMERCGMKLCLHGEAPDSYLPHSRREKAFIGKTLWKIVDAFPKLVVILEHVSTAVGVDYVLEGPPTLFATITPHHLFLTRDDVDGVKLHPHHFCRPIPQTTHDRLVLGKAATSGNPKFFLGTDSAPHPRERKECADGAAGVFNAPVAPAVLTKFFLQSKCIEKLEPFVSEFGARAYGLPLNEETITIVRKPWVVPQQYGDIVPFMAGETLQWQVE
ncbi:dihydroorotase [Candidatus Azambacteria bacterium]|nr:dihydroorotase [Candidatus Azambacteria bacterium]MBI3685566.1 dihydroorotase [Candidatus Azambacteria bacterium]